MLIRLLSLSPVCLIWVCWVRGNFSGGPGHIYSVCGSAVWSAGPVQFYLGFLLERMAGLYRFSPLWLCCSGYGTVKWWGGGPSFSAFSSLLSAFLAVGCLR